MRRSVLITSLAAALVLAGAATGCAGSDAAPTITSIATSEEPAIGGASVPATTDAATTSSSVVVTTATVPSTTAPGAIPPATVPATVPSPPVPATSAPPTTARSANTSTAPTLSPEDLDRLEDELNAIDAILGDLDQSFQAD